MTGGADCVAGHVIGGIGNKQQNGPVFHRIRKHGHVSSNSPWPGARFCYNSNICLGIPLGK